ncbi:non-ribosomal peptide synthetase [Streptomyces sclerotialus]|uniref:non-ribosomal peptide synthetase n=1 Tax=Streptomyces sclerotialus TaxID=1957 RepID=UPI00099BA678
MATAPLGADHDRAREERRSQVERELPDERQEAHGLLWELAEHGVTVRARRGRLKVDAPEGTPAALMDRVTAAEPALLAAVASRPGSLGPRLDGTAGDGPDPEPFALTDLQSAYHVGESDYPQLRTAACVAHGFEVPDLDEERLRTALRTVMARHEMLRAAVDEEGRQRVVPLAPGWGPAVVDWSGLAPGPAREAFTAERAGAADALPPLTAGPQLSCTVYRAQGTSFVLLCLRLFVLDARSIGLVCRDLAAAYEDRPCTGPTAPPGLFRRYVTALAEHRSSQAYRNSVAHWRRRAAELPPPPPLPLLGRPDHAAFARVRHRLPAPVWQRLQERARMAGLSANTVLCTAYAEVLRRWSGRPDISLTVLVATRGMLAADGAGTGPALDACVGNFGSTLLLGCDGAGDTFARRAEALQLRLMEDLPHAWLSAVELARMRRRTQPGAEPASPYVFASGLDTTAGGPLPPHLQTPGWDLVFKAMHTPQVLLDHQVSEEDGELVCTFDHVAAAFPEGLVQELAAAHADLLHRLAAGPAAWTDPHPPALPPALLRAREDANATRRSFPHARVLDGLRRGAADAPGRPAFIGEDGTLGYGAAAAEVGRIAAELTAAGADRGELVGVLARKSTAQYLGALAVVAAGCAYVPLGVDWPAARIEALLGRHGITRVLTDAHGSRLLDQVSHPLTAVPLDAPAGPAGPAVLREGDGADLAYVIFTSGSTGAPKGVAIPHSGLLNTVQDMVERFGIGPDDRLLSLSELHFDLSAFDLFGALHSGAAVVVPPLGGRPDPELWATWLRRSGATVWNTVPALMEMLLDHLGDRAADALGGLRLVLLSGDWIPLGLPERIARAAPKARTVALGGATEASIWSNYHVVDGVDPAWKSVPYGRPLANQRYHVLDAHLADVPHWVPGDLFIAGEGLATAYYGQPELTTERFPCHPRTGERLYRTGDQARYWPDGTLEFLGRTDHQVKVRGYRVDLLEVEQQLAAVPGVRAAACVVLGTGADARLVAFVVPAAVGEEQPDALDAAELRSRLARTLPGYAVPGAFHPLPALPLTANGKRDTRKLLELAGTEVPRTRSAAAGRAPARPPRTEREKTLARLWEQVCGVPVASVDDDFFAVGGSSVTAVRLLRRIEAEFGIRLPLSSLFEASTVAGQAALLDRGAETLLVPVRPEGDAVVVLVHPVGGHLLGYRDLIGALPEHWAVYGLQSPEPARLPATLDALADRYATALDALDGRPVHLLGWSMGGVLAAETARRCPAGDVRSLTVIDSFVQAPESCPPSVFDATAAAVGFFADHVGQRADAAAVDAPPPGHPDPFGYLAARHVPDEPTGSLGALYEQYHALYRLLLTHRPRPLPGAVPTLVVHAEGERGDVFRGLTPLRRHPGGLVPAGAVQHALPGTHYSVMRGEAARTVGRLFHSHLSQIPNTLEGTA